MSTVRNVEGRNIEGLQESRHVGPTLIVTVVTAGSMEEAAQEVRALAVV